jgi:hypothetical protein
MKLYSLFAGIVMVFCSQLTIMHTMGYGLFMSQVPTSVAQAAVDVNKQNEIVQTSLKEESIKLNLQPLTENQSQDEIRFWVGFGLITPRCFTLKRVKGAEESMYYATTSKRLPDAVPLRYQVENIATALASPKSGWTNLNGFLKTNGIDYPVGLKSDFNYLADPDGEMIVIEIKSAGAYSMVFFPTNTESPDGLKARSVCKKIEDEFNIKMGCSRLSA